MTSSLGSANSAQTVSASRSAGITSLYYNYHWPLALVDLLSDLASDQQSDPNAPVISTLWMSRVFFSQPRSGNDPTGEVLTVNFQVPVPVGETTIELLRVSANFQLWYQDRNNNWIQMRDENYQPLNLNLSTSAATSWYKWHCYCYPVVAKALQIRVTRNYDPTLGIEPYSIGIRNGLLRRNVYNRSAGNQAMEDEQDSMGNVIAKYIQDWDAADAIDDNATSFWRSEPLPDPSAVANLFLDLRTPAGDSQLIDTLYIDPVYINQTLNIYYSIDDTVGRRTLSPVSLPPDTDENTQWTDGVGLTDISGNGTASYQVPLAVGPLVSTDAWIGVEWTPDFDPSSGPAQNPVLLGVWPGTDCVQVLSIDGDATGGTFEVGLDGTNYTTNLAGTVDGDALQAAFEDLSAVGTSNVLVAGEPGGPWTFTFQGDLGQQPVDTISVVSSLTGTPTPTMHVDVIQPGISPPNGGGTQYWPRLYYDVGAGEIVLEFTNGATAKTYPVALSPVLAPGVPLRIVAAWSYDPQPTVFLSVQTSSGTTLGTTTVHPSDLPTNISLDGEVGYYDFAGTMTATVVKLENYQQNYPAFMANPEIYVNPNPVQPDPSSGQIPSTTLDNAMLAVDWTLQDVPYGGGHASFYANKTWTPIFANYITQKGKLYFPQSVMAKYLKLEFSNLTEETYPVYDSGISLMYQVYPISVLQQAAAVPPSTVQSGMVSIGGQAVAGGIGSVNWLNAASVTAATNSVFGQTVQPMPITNGTSSGTGGSLPNTSGSDAGAITKEVATPWVYRRGSTNTKVLAAQMIKVLAQSGTAGGSGTQSLSPLTNAATTSASMVPAMALTPSSTALPLQGTDYWLVPGQTLALPAPVMSGLTQGSQVVVNKKPSTAYRLRFNTTCVHQYQTKVVVRDAAIAYFAGVREVSAYVTNYIANQDPPQFVFSPYTPTAFTYDANIVQLPTGPISTAGQTYLVENPGFDVSLENWTQAQGVWSCDAGAGKWQYGSATVVADGTEKELLSVEVTCWPKVTPGANFTAVVQAQWSAMVSGSGSHPLQLQANYYTDEGTTFVSGQTASITASGTSLWASAGGAVITGNFTVPSTGGVDTIRLGLVVTPDATAGQAWFDTGTVDSADIVEATTYIDLTTQSTFNKVRCDFTDSGLVRSDSMWADIDPNNTNISSTQLAYYTSTIPENIPSGTWGDTFATWADPTITWGEPQAVVSINVDPNMTFNGLRVLHFTRVAGAGEAGIKVRQSTNFVASGMFRIGASYYYPTATGNQIIVRLRRVSDGVYIYEQTVTPVAGYWYEFTTPLIEIPDSADQIYTVEFVLTGDAADEIYINDLYTECAQIRYHCRLGAEGEFLHDITELRYVDTSIVSCTSPVNEVLIQTTILSPTAWAYSARLTPNYLK